MTSTALRFNRPLHPESPLRHGGGMSRTRWAAAGIFVGQIAAMLLMGSVGYFLAAALQHTAH